MHTFRMPANRWQASLIHVGISAILYVVLLYLIVFHWYPQPYFAVDGGWEGVQIITGVDLVLGPVLTLMVYNRRKPELKRDLAIIGAIQLVALVWGTWLVYGQRTAAVVFAAGRFQTLSIEQVADAGERAVKMVADAASHPPYFMVSLPADGKKRFKLIAETAGSGVPMSMRGDLYQPIDAGNRMEILESAIDIGQRVEGFEDDRATLDAFLARHGGSAADYGFVPLSARYRFLLLGLSRKDASVVGALDIRPTVRIAPPPAAGGETKPAAPRN